MSRALRLPGGSQPPLTSTTATLPAAALKRSFDSEYDGGGESGKPARGPVEEKMPDSYYDQMKKAMLQRQERSKAELLSL